MSLMDRSPQTAIQMIGWSSGLIFSITGGSVSFGSRLRTAATLSRTSWADCSRLRSRKNSTVTMEYSSILRDVMDLTPLIVFTASSMMSVTSTSMISGLAPTSFVVMFTTGKSIFGKRSRASFGNATRPNTMSARPTMVMNTGRLIDISGSLMGILVL